jgi:uncharacterized protein
MFVLETFLQAPEMFDTFIAIDPTLWRNNRQILKTAADTLRARKRLDKAIGHPGAMRAFRPVFKPAA